MCIDMWYDHEVKNTSDNGETLCTENAIVEERSLLKWRDASISKRKDMKQDFLKAKIFLSSKLFLKWRGASQMQVISVRKDIK